MRKIALTVAMCCAMVIGVAQAMWDLEQPVGGVSDQFCKRPEKPCTAFNYEVTHERIAKAP